MEPSESDFLVSASSSTDNAKSDESNPTSAENTCNSAEANEMQVSENENLGGNYDENNGNGGSDSGAAACWDNDAALLSKKTPAEENDDALSLNEYLAITEAARKQAKDYFASQNVDFDENNTNHRDTLCYYRDKITWDALHMKDVAAKVKRTENALAAKYGASYKKIDEAVAYYMENEIPHSLHERYVDAIRAGDTEVIFSIYDTVAKRNSSLQQNSKAHAPLKRMIFPPHVITGGTLETPQRRSLAETDFLG